LVSKKHMIINLLCTLAIFCNMLTIAVGDKYGFA